MAKNVWFQLVDAATGVAYAGTQTASVSSEGVNDIDDLRGAIRKKYREDRPDILSGVIASQLRIHDNIAAYIVKKTSEDDSSIDTLDRSMKNALIVEVPTPHLVPDHAVTAASVGPEIPSAKRQRTEAVEPREVKELKELVAVAQQLEGAKAGTLLQTPTAIFGAAYKNGLYIRQEYCDLQNIIADKLASDPWIRRVLVVGSPGIGKSVFGVYLLLQLMTQQRDVAYRPLRAARPCVYYFSWNTNTNAYEISTTPRAGIKYVGLFDGSEGDGALDVVSFEHAFLFAGPSTRNFNQFVKENCFQVYMNPWRKAECQHFAEALQLEDQDEWALRFNLVGGKPRFLFLSAETFGDLLNRVRDSIPDSIGALEEKVRLFSQDVFVFHMYRDEENPTRSYLTYASSVVVAMASCRYNIQSADELRAMLQTPSSYLQPWQGRELEKYLKTLPPECFV